MDGANFASGLPSFFPRVARAARKDHAEIDGRAKCAASATGLRRVLRRARSVYFRT